MNKLCIIGKGEKTRLGYIRAEIKGKRILAHRLAYEAFYGPIPKNLEIDHLCHNKSCVNVNHLEAVTHQVNSQRRKNAKLDLQKVQEIRNFLNLSLKYQEIADKYHVSKQMVFKIKHNKAWKC